MVDTSSVGVPVPAGRNLFSLNGEGPNGGYELAKDTPVLSVYFEVHRDLRPALGASLCMTAS